MNRSALSLLETVVVTAIVSLLLWLALPTLGNCRYSAQAMMCSSRLKSVNTALHVYQDQNSSFPAAIDCRPVRRTRPHGSAANPVYDKSGTWWYIALQLENSQRSELWCPSRKISDQKIKSNVLCANYGVNLAVCKSIDTPASKSVSGLDIRKPAVTMLAMDAGYSSVAWYHTLPANVYTGNLGQDLAYIPGMQSNQYRKLRTGTNSDAILPRHMKKSLNASYADGHVDKTTPFGPVSCSQPQPGSFWLP